MLFVDQTKKVSLLTILANFDEKNMFQHLLLNHLKYVGLVFSKMYLISFSEKANLSHSSDPQSSSSSAVVQHFTIFHLVVLTLCVITSLTSNCFMNYTTDEMCYLMTISNYDHYMHRWNIWGLTLVARALHSRGGKQRSSLRSWFT